MGRQVNKKITKGMLQKVANDLVADIEDPVIKTLISECPTVYLTIRGAEALLDYQRTKHMDSLITGLRLAVLGVAKLKLEVANQDEVS